MKRYEKLEKDPVARELEILELWQRTDAFGESLRQTENGPRYVFYEGPPTANGRPHFGHLMPRVYKDLFPRYKTMQGHYVVRKGGWDTHGLPVELEVEKEIGVNSKPEIESYGVERFVQKCKESVWRYKAEWERLIRRMGFWIDLENAYVTYTDDYIESVWWELATMFERGLLYQGHKTLPYCPRCGTGLSSHEVAQGYKVVEDPSVFLRMPIVSDAASVYKLDGGVRTSLLTWTTTPWTLPANVALAMAANEAYVEVEQGSERLVLAKALMERALVGDARIVREMPGRDLLGVLYEPPYRLTSDAAAYQVYSAGFVNMDDGTGIVHIACAFGEDDYRLGQEEGLPFVQPVDLGGRFTEEFPLCAGQFVKDADPVVVADLKNRGLLYRSMPYEHDYPFCWRCDTPLLYYAMDSWYIRTTEFKDRMIEENEGISWYPSHVGEGRLGDFLENLKDWALSRDRYWGTPLNLWVCEECGTVSAVKSRADLVARATDPERARTVELHRPYVDAITLRCEACGGVARRVRYVIDTWFDSGSMHTAQWHYPFENEDRFRDSFPADFICEAMEQTRGWFYTLLATATILHGEAPYRNCMATGLGLDENGLKMSKSKGNVLDPWTYIDRFGADCIRWYLFSSSAPWKSKRIGEAAVQEPLYKFLDTVRNTYDFFALYATIDGYDPDVHPAREASFSILDRWIRSRLQTATRDVVTALDAYDVVSAAAALEAFVDDLSNWYVRLSRRRFWRGGMGEDKAAAYGTLREALLVLSRLLAPFVPFLAEAVYQPLRAGGDPESVHLCAYPAVDEDSVDSALESEMQLARSIAALGHQARNQAQVKVRQPLAHVVIASPGDVALRAEVQELIERELNVRRVDVVKDLGAYLTEAAAPNFRSIGPRLGASGPKAAAWIKGQSASALRNALATGSVTVAIGGETVEIRPEDVTYTVSLSEGYVQAETGSDRLLLDTRIDEDLRRQGLFREVVHRIQVARKDAGFDVTDRIRLAYETDDALGAILAQHEEEIAAEVLAVSVKHDMKGKHEYSQTIELDEGRRVAIGLTRMQDA
ncbi:MAG: isoleucine--tRNA ligase [Candidatus Bipolaricaulota bacterium]|nr:isoleucine--tRNA ligase [Candidatus Bipolaricaulota bacterium]